MILKDYSKKIDKEFFTTRCFSADSVKVMLHFCDSCLPALGQ